MVVLHPFTWTLDANTVAIIVCVITAIVVPFLYRRDKYPKQADDMAHAQQELEDQVKDLNERLNQLYDDNGEMRGMIREYSTHDMQQVEYIREVGHWMAQACEAMDVDEAWLHAHPKPRLPESIRHELPKNKQHLPSERKVKK